MKPTIFLIALFIAATSHAQNVDYTVFNPKHMKKEYFVSTNSGVLKTPVGIKVGYISNPGLYVGTRFGKGTTLDSHFETRTSNLFSIVVGATRPLIIKGDFKMVAQLGIGYGEWWDYRWESWTKSGFEMEGGLLFQKKRYVLNITGNALVGDRTYTTGDFCLGIGYVLNK